MEISKCKKVLVTTLALVLSISTCLTGCGSKNSNDTQGNTTQAVSQDKTADQKVEQKNVSLTVWTGPDWKGVFSPDEANAQNGDWFRHTTQEYSKANPNVKMEAKVEVIPYADMVSKLNVAVASNSSPDVWSYSHFNMYQYITQGSVIALDDVISSEDKSSIPAAMWNAATSEGKVYFYPFASLPTCLMINKDIFEKAGALDKLPLSKDDRAWTNEEFKDALKAVTKNGTTPYYGYGIHAGNREFDSTNFVHMWSYGASTFSSDYSKVEINSDKGVQALDFLNSLAKEKLTVPSPATMKYNDTFNMFLEQKVSVVDGDPSTVKWVQDSLKEKGMQKFNVDIVMYPSSDGKPKTVNYIYGLLAFKTADEAKMDFAKKYIAFCAKPEYAKAFTAIGAHPVHKDLSEVFADKPEWKVGKNMIQYDADLGSRVGGYSEIRNLFFPAMQAVFTGSKTSKQALDDFAKQADEVIQKYKK